MEFTDHEYGATMHATLNANHRIFNHYSYAGVRAFGRSPEVPFMQSAAAACICNLAANLNSKETIATSGALEVLVDVLQSENQAAAAQVCSRGPNHTASIILHAVLSAVQSLF